MRTRIERETMRALNVSSRRPPRKRGRALHSDDPPTYCIYFFFYINTFPCPKREWDFFLRLYLFDWIMAKHFFVVGNALPRPFFFSFYMLSIFFRAIYIYGVDRRMIFFMLVGQSG